jgi:hypothetical protein
MSVSADPYYSQFMMLPENCVHHPQVAVEIYCSCDSKLCLSCLRDHYHENLSYSPIKETVGNFHNEVNKILLILNDQINKLKGKSHATSVTLSVNLSQILAKIREIINTRYFITYDILMEFKKENFSEKVCELILSYYKNQSVKNKPLLEEMMKKKKYDNATLHSTKKEKNFKNKKNKIFPNKKEKENFNEKVKLDIKESSLTISKSKGSDANKFISNNVFQSNIHSNKEVFDPFEGVETAVQPQIVTVKRPEPVSNFAEEPVKVPVIIPMSRAAVFDMNLVEKAPPYKPKGKFKVSSTYFKENTLNYNFNYDNNNEFLDSATTTTKTSKNDIVKIVCITCRDKFSVVREQSWRTRCDVCTENYN